MNVRLATLPDFKHLRSRVVGLHGRSSVREHYRVETERSSFSEAPAGHASDILSPGAEEEKIEYDYIRKRKKEKKNDVRH